MRVFKIPKITRGQRALKSCYISRCRRTEAGFEVPFSTSQSPLILSNLCWIYLNAVRASGCCSLPAAPGELSGPKAQPGVISERARFCPRVVGDQDFGGAGRPRGSRPWRSATRSARCVSTPHLGCATPMASFPCFGSTLNPSRFLNCYSAFQIHRKHLLLS